MHHAVLVLVVVALIIMNKNVCMITQAVNLYNTQNGISVVYSTQKKNLQLIQNKNIIAAKEHKMMIAQIIENIGFLGET